MEELRYVTLAFLELILILIIGDPVNMTAHIKIVKARKIEEIMEVRRTNQ